MSAFMVGKIHIDLLVDCAFKGPRDHRGPQGYPLYRPYWKGRLLTDISENDLGDAFIKENLSSIHYRYPDTFAKLENTPGPINNYWLQPYELTRPKHALTVVEAFKALNCYEYQACEHPEWEESDIAQFCKAFQGSLIKCLPGYHEAPWEWYEGA